MWSLKIRQWSVKLIAWSVNHLPTTYRQFNLFTITKTNHVLRVRPLLFSPANTQDASNPHSHSVDLPWSNSSWQASVFRKPLGPGYINFGVILGGRACDNFLSLIDSFNLFYCVGSVRAIVISIVKSSVRFTGSYTGDGPHLGIQFWEFVRFLVRKFQVLCVFFGWCFKFVCWSLPAQKTNARIHVIITCVVEHIGDKGMETSFRKVGGREGEVSFQSLRWHVERKSKSLIRRQTWMRRSTWNKAGHLQSDQGTQGNSGLQVQLSPVVVHVGEWFAPSCKTEFKVPRCNAFSLLHVRLK